MTLVTSRMLWCDHPDCEAEAGFEPDAKSLRRYAAKHGWTRFDGRDFCPEHTPEAANTASDGRPLEKTFALPNAFDETIGLVDDPGVVVAKDPVTTAEDDSLATSDAGQLVPLEQTLGDGDALLIPPSIRITVDGHSASVEA